MASKLAPRTRALLDKIIRVDHAGEIGANRIYQGQLAILGKTPDGPTISVSSLNTESSGFLY
ncbi:unnamed protein product [Protopolystoma xenopodis]|uniref:Uncharacterized protein n=1 Tax=Protopolystoma xenopodis TaxID=117903 RepID=A0A448XQI1_9PLAT|nr:unnamed protein product [Protopolystoma xenopodis]